MEIDRRNFIKTTAVAGAGLAIAPGIAFGKGLTDSKLRLGFVGVGLRGTWHLENSLNRNDVEVTAICDIDPERLKICQKMIKDAGQHKAEEFGKDAYDYRNL